jgi:diguanylate cyclase (GGDEF)-like protein
VQTETDSPNPMKAPTLVLEARRLKQVIWAALAAVAASVVLPLWHGSWVTAAQLLATAGLLLLALWYVGHGGVERSAKLMLATLTLSMICLLFQHQGLRDEALCAFPGIMVFAGMFATRRVFLTMLLFIVGALTLIGTAEIQGWHASVIPAVTVGSLINVVRILLVTAFFVWLMAGDLRLALLRLETENERIRESFARIDTLAHHDALTGLPNRLLARDRFEQVIALSRRSQTSAALLYLDLDDFKAVNDSLGHAAGDLLLCDVADRLSHAVRASDTVSRQGGDEFLIVMADFADDQAVAATAVKIIDQLARPFYVNGLELSATCSLGIALFPEDGGDFDTLLKNADMAMYRAKDSGRNAFRFYHAEMNTSVIEHLHLISGIRSALARGEFTLHYQPQYHLESGRIVGAEALIRWRHPELGYIPPAKFIPVAERSGLIHEVGAWVLNEACGQAKQWQAAGLTELVVAINLSPIQFRRDDIEREVTNALAAWDLAPSSIELELTESMLIADSHHLTGLLSRLRGLGIRLSIDDFGTGYSNLGYLKRFEVERLKIDQSFVRRLTENANDEGIVRAIIEMAHSLKLEAVAEGIENEATLNRLIELGCEYGQGFHWAPALPADEFFKFVTKGETAAAG